MIRVKIFSDYLLVILIFVEFSCSACGSPHFESKQDLVEDVIPEQKLQFGATWGRKFCNWKVKIPDISSDHVKTNSRNKIIGMAKGPAYTYGKLLPFCKSVRKAGFQGKVLLGISSLKGIENRKRVKMFEKFNITGVYLDGVKDGEWGQSICRYYAYMKLIEAFATEKDHILVSDVRDVFFQADPFSSIPFGSENFISTNTKLLLFSEGLNDILAGNATLRNTRGNFRWLRNIYGVKKANILGGNPVLCSGTTIGTKSGMLYYTRAMLYEGYSCLKRNPHKFDGKRGHVCSGGADQGFHNFLFWNNLLLGAELVQNAAGPVYTVGIFRGKPVRYADFDRDQAGRVISPPKRGSSLPVPVIHQWDRHQDLLNYVFEEFDLADEGLNKRKFSSNLLAGSYSGKVKTASTKG